MISTDVRLILYQIKTVVVEKKLTCSKEILQTVEKVSYCVISQMENEVKTKCMYLPKEESENCHVVKHNKNIFFYGRHESLFL